MPKKLTKNSDRPLELAEEKEIRLAVGRGYKHLKLKRGRATPMQIQEAMLKTIDSIMDSKKRKTARAIEDLAIDLGCLWGQTVCDTIGWEWCFATIGIENVFAVAPPNRSYVVAPMCFVQTQLQKRPPEDNTSLLLFNMIVGGSLPKAKAGTYITVG